MSTVGTNTENEPVEEASVAATEPAVEPDVGSGPAGDRVIAAGGSGSRPELVEAMDRVSLEQALSDFAVANARVLDLTRRLTTMTEEMAELRDENVRLRIAAGRLRDLEESSAYQVVRAGRAGVTLTRRFVTRLRRR